MGTSFLTSGKHSAACTCGWRCRQAHGRVRPVTLPGFEKPSQWAGRNAPSPRLTRSSGNELSDADILCPFCFFVQQKETEFHDLASRSDLRHSKPPSAAA